MGDPTLRMAVVKPPTDVHAVPDAGGATVEWAASADTNLLGYKVYQAASADGPFANISGPGYVTGTSFPTTVGAYAGTVFMVRAFKLETSNTGTYINASQGAFSEVQSGLVVGIGRDSRAYVGSVALTFNQPVNFGADAVSVTRRENSGPTAPLDINVWSDDDGLSYIITLVDEDGANMAFDSDVYDVHVQPSAITLVDTATPLNETDYTHMFFRLAGDASGNGTVDFNDFLILQSDFGSTASLAADSDGNDVVDFNDFLLLQSQFGITLSF